MGFRFYRRPDVERFRRARSLVKQK